MFGMVNPSFKDDDEDDDDLNDYISDDVDEEKDQLLGSAVPTAGPALKELLSSYSSMSNKSDRIGPDMNDNLAKWLHTCMVASKLCSSGCQEVIGDGRASCQLFCFASSSYQC